MVIILVISIQAYFNYFIKLKIIFIRDSYYSFDFQFD